MKATMKRRLACAVLLAGLTCAAFGQGAESRRGQGAPAQGPKSYTADFVAVADTVGKAHGIKIVVDPGLFVAAPPAEPKQAASAEAAVNSLVAPVKNCAWRKVYMMRNEASSGIPAGRLAAMVRAIDILETGGLVLENPATRRAVSLQKNMPVLPGFADELKSLRFDPAPVYVVYSTLGAGSGGSAQDKFLDLQRQQLELMMQMDADTLAGSMAQAMQMLSSLDPQTRTQLFGTMMRAGTQMFMQMDPQARTEMIGGMMRSGMEMWASMPPDQREKLTRDMMQMGQQIMGQMGGPPGGRPPL